MEAEEIVVLIIKETAEMVGLAEEDNIQITTYFMAATLCNQVQLLEDLVLKAEIVNRVVVDLHAGMVAEVVEQEQ